jgi:large conductance mechanosensitive channel
MVKVVNRIRATEPPPPAVTPEDIILLREIRDSLQNKKGS